MRNPAPDHLDATYTRSLFESSLDGMVITDASGRALEANTAALSLPLSRIEPLLEPPEEPDAELFGFHEQLQTRGHASTEIRVRNRCGQLQHVLVEGRTMSLSRRLFILRDVTLLRKLQEELSTVRRLESLGHFTATLAHDVNNVLAPIHSLSELIVREAGDGTPIASLARDVTELTKSGSSLVKRIVRFARGEPTEPQRVDLTAQIEKVHALADHLLGNSITLCLSLERAPCHVFVDPVIFEHVLLNVLANARDAIFENGVHGKIKVRTSNVLLGFTESEAPGSLPRGRYAMLSITDDGGGMPADVCEQALESFFSTKGESHGLGLGLANAKRFVEAAGGSISVRSEPDVGTTVTLHLPRVD
jgi:signal transduction histidine kinase